MGYMGLSCTGDSDTAADLSYLATKTLAKVLQQGLEYHGNVVNTSGTINVALFFEEYIKKCPSYHEELHKVLCNTINKLKEEIATYKKTNWGDDKNKNYHLKATRRMLKILEKMAS